MDRTERVREVVDRMLREQPNEVERRCAFVHLYGVAQTCAFLALRRGLDPELGTVAGMLHDLWSYKTLDTTDHGRLGALLAREILSDLGCYTADEIETICHAILHHSEKVEVHGPTDELLKDADVLQHYLYNARLPRIEKHRARLSAVLEELEVK